VVLRQVVTRGLELMAGPQPEDHALRWRGTADAGRPVVRVAHFGDCGWREMALSHGVHTDPGYPKAMAEALAEHGVGMEFSSWVVAQLEWLPGYEYLDVHLRLTGDPDLVIVQLGAIHSRLALLPDTPELLRLRERVGRALGRHVLAAQHMVRPAQAAFGRFLHPYGGVEPLVTFLGDVRRRWPQARIVVLLPWLRTIACARQREVMDRVRVDERAAAEAAGVEWLDVAEDAHPDRCANGYNLGPEASRRVGRRLAREVRLPARA
jgi:hypothetical protein